jgi:hypothetical protein
VVDTEGEATAMINARQANIAVVVPEDAAATIRGGEQAIITILHDRSTPSKRE